MGVDGSVEATRAAAHLMQVRSEDSERLDRRRLLLGVGHVGFKLEIFFEIAGGEIAGYQLAMWTVDLGASYLR